MKKKTGRSNARNVPSSHHTMRHYVRPIQSPGLKRPYANRFNGRGSTDGDGDGPGKLDPIKDRRRKKKHFQDVSRITISRPPQLINTRGEEKKYYRYYYVVPTHINNPMVSHQLKGKLVESPNDLPSHNNQITLKNSKQTQALNGQCLHKADVLNAQKTGSILEI